MAQVTTMATNRQHTRITSMTSGKQLTGTELHTRQKTNKNLNGPCIICDGIKTPENFGAILRVADAIGSQEIILLDSDLDLKNKKLSNLARKTNTHLKITNLSLDEFIKSRSNYKALYALEITTYSQNLFNESIIDCDAVVIGHESNGISNAVLDLCDQAIHLPMFGTNSSMNISHALAVFLYEWRRQEKCDL